ncbi:efflux RND transporter periplasmic adaptor subunit [Lignipirellula cremea]|uniref:Efflux pump periplasmic linker BepF n=1 Tax=Lignipirellula cremea TaxID=2528010 RepID=A0A518DXV7_9BACT|nr:efflux RND transporter periplasmic adaptor subunit [Lignipirellula cremea]QDU96682.1 Efflux pump periplasmic linker BepF [Lignipirellula cremea]
MRPYRPTLPLFAGWLLLALALAGCRPRNEFKPPPDPEVTVAHPLLRPIVDTVDFSGATSAVARVEIRARVNGYLDAVEFEDGSHVQQGELLFSIEREPYEIARKTAEAEKARADAAEQLAKANLSRSLQLLKDRAVAQAQVDVHRAELQTAEANIKAAQAAIDQAELNLGYTEIRAPLSGRIGRRLLDPGNLVHAEEDVLAVIESIDPIYATFFVSESDILRFMEMLRNKELPDPTVTPPVLYLGLENEQDFPHKGKLDFRELGVDPNTGTILRRGSFSNDDGTLIPGLSVRIRAPIGPALPRLLVEERAVGADQRGEYLLVVGKDNTVEYRPVQLGIQVGELRVIRSGVTEEDLVIVNGLQRARPGGKVRTQLVETELKIPASRDGESGGGLPPTEPAESAQVVDPAETQNAESSEANKPAEAGETEDASKPDSAEEIVKPVPNDSAQDAPPLAPAGARPPATEPGASSRRNRKEPG